MTPNFFAERVLYQRNFRRMVSPLTKAGQALYVASYFPFQSCHSWTRLPCATCHALTAGQAVKDDALGFPGACGTVHAVG